MTAKIAVVYVHIAGAKKKEVIAAIRSLQKRCHEGQTVCAVEDPAKAHRKFMIVREGKTRALRKMVGIDHIQAV